MSATVDFSTPGQTQTGASIEAPPSAETVTQSPSDTSSDAAISGESPA
jgi:hypothetical protein